MQVAPTSFYVRRLKPRLEAVISQTAPSRLLWLPVHLAVISAAVALLVHGVPLLAELGLSLLIGCAFGGMMFLGHETSHGAVVKGRRARSLVAQICFIPLMLSERLWSRWHGRFHHANANRLDLDPDMYPSLTAYRDSVALRVATDHFALGGTRLRGMASLVVGFSLQSAQMLVWGRARCELTARDQRRSYVEFAVCAAVWIAFGVALGGHVLLFAWLLPLLVANVIVMSFIMTNHMLSPATDCNDPIVGSLSVTIPRWAEWLTLDFGYHTEHHLFPAASTRHARAIRDALVAEFPDRYQSLPLSVALWRVFRTGRVYRDATTLVEPRSGRTWPTLGSGPDPDDDDQAGDPVPSVA
ncbi:MAG TPA: fatty acid desaturase [Kofleriaceae bacterium]